MRKEEARWIGETLKTFGDSISPVIELGTTSREYREALRPHIAQNIHKPLGDRGIKIVTTDLFDKDGVDIAGDIYQPEIQARLVAVGANCVLVCNIFEHVSDSSGFAAICDTILRPGGLMVVSVPYSYPYHLDPIDTMFRPTPEEIIGLFPGYQLIEKQIVRSTTDLQDLRETRSPAGVVLHVTKELARSAALRGGAQKSLARLHRLTWLFRPYSVSCAVLRKPAAP